MNTLVTNCDKIAQIYLPDLPLFATLQAGDHHHHHHHHDHHNRRRYKNPESWFAVFCFLFPTAIASSLFYLKGYEKEKKQFCYAPGSTHQSWQVWWNFWQDQDNLDCGAILKMQLYNTLHRGNWLAACNGINRGARNVLTSSVTFNLSRGTFAFCPFLHSSVQII